MSTTEELLAEQKAILVDILRTQKEHTTKLNMVCTALFGNGEPGRSLFSTVQRNTTYLKLLGIALLAVPTFIGLVFATVKLLTG